MRAGMILGIVGGVVALLFGLIVFGMGMAIGEAAGALGQTETQVRSNIVGVLGLVLPIMAIIGGAIASSNRSAACWMIGIPAAAFVYIAIDSQQMFFFVIAAILALSVYLVATAKTDAAH